MTVTTLRALTIAHHYDYDPGFVGVAAAQLGISLHMVAREDRNIPDPREFDLVIPFGSAWSVALGEEPDAVALEQQTLRLAHQQKIPIFGICFGGQQLAAALGGAVIQTANPEIGLTPVVTSHPIVPTGSWMEFHLDEMQPPIGATTLATTKCVQAFRLGHSLGLQFHPEATKATFARWLNQGGEQYLSRVGKTTDDIMAECDLHAPNAQAQTTLLFTNFLASVGLRETSIPALETAAGPVSEPTAGVSQ
jgi:GMP synthase-like glutamine amidotransferase